MTAAPQSLQPEADEPLIERLRNPMWAHGNIPFESPQLEQEENLAAMREAADRIEFLEATEANQILKLKHQVEGLTKAPSELETDVIDAMCVYRDHEPEEGESWESWYFAAFDLACARVREIFKERRTLPTPLETRGDAT